MSYLTSKSRKCPCGRPAMFLGYVCRFCWLSPAVPEEQQ